MSRLLLCTCLCVCAIGCCAHCHWLWCALRLSIRSCSNKISLALVAYPPFSLYHSSAISRSRRPWASNFRRDDRKRYHRDEFDEFVQKKKREIMDFKADNDRLRADNQRLRAELDRKDAELERQTKKAKAALESVFALLTAPKNEDTDSMSEQGGDGAASGRGEDPLRPQPSEDATANGPGEAAPGPPQRKEEEATMQDEAPEHAIHSRSEVPEMPHL